MTAEYLSTDPIKYKNKYECVLVDEYQDTNVVQLKVVTKLCRDHARVTVVGDPNQSIYGWRGASEKNWTEFNTHFENHKEVFLCNNYRSAPTIVNLCNRLISLNGVDINLVSKKEVK